VILAPGTQQGQRVSKPVELIDVYPTLLQLAGLPSNDQQQGQSLVPLIKDPTSRWDHPAVTSFGRGNVSIRSDRYRLIQYRDGSRELYDLDIDPHEWTNLALQLRFCQRISTPCCLAIQPVMTPTPQPMQPSPSNHINRKTLTTASQVRLG
jgi:arylsulfatase A-like enzyme